MRSLVQAFFCSIIHAYWLMHSCINIFNWYMYLFLQLCKTLSRNQTKWASQVLGMWCPCNFLLQHAFFRTMQFTVPLIQFYSYWISLLYFFLWRGQPKTLVARRLHPLDLLQLLLLSIWSLRHLHPSLLPTVVGIFMILSHFQKFVPLEKFHIIRCGLLGFTHIHTWW